MSSLFSVHRAAIALSATLFSIVAFGVQSGAQTFTTSDQGFSFSYPQRWEAADANGAVKITAPDGSRYTLKLDLSIETAVTAGHLVNDA